MNFFRWLDSLFAPPAPEPEPESYSVVLKSRGGRVTAEICPTLNMARSRLLAAQRAGVWASGEIVTPSMRVVDYFSN